MPSLRKVLGAASIAASVAGCATPGPSQQTWVPTVDQRGIDSARYQTDLAECRAYADANPEANASEQQRDGAMKMGLVTGAIAVGATIMTGGLAAIPIVGAGLLGTASAGAVGGAVTGNMVANANYRETVNQCLTGRGYSVIG